MLGKLGTWTIFEVKEVGKYGANVSLLTPSNSDENGCTPTESATAYVAKAEELQPFIDALTEMQAKLKAAREG